MSPDGASEQNAPDAEAAQKRALVGFGAPFVILLVLSLFFLAKIPPNHQLMAVPGVLLMVAATLPFMFWETVAARKTARAIATYSSCGLWVLSLVLAFSIKPPSVWVFVGDALLLIGFFPLLYFWRFSWTWLVFGVLNLSIGILLQVIAYIPDSFFPANLLPPKHHLMEFHPPIAWMLVGVAATVFGAGRLAKNIFALAASKRKKNADETQPAEQSST